jgi:hypothetical protein
MTKRAFVLVLLGLVCTSFAYGHAQQPVPAPQPVASSAQPPTPAPAPQSGTPQATQKPTPAPTMLTPRTAPEPPSPMLGPNVRIEVTITDQTGTAAPIKKTLSVTCNRSGSVRAGVNVPLPQTTFGQPLKDAGQPVPVTTYNYKNMGLSLDVTDLYVQDNMIRTRISLEYQPVEEGDKAAPGAPQSYAGFSQSLYLALENGKPVVAAVTSDPVPSHSRTLSVEVKGTIVK